MDNDKKQTIIIAITITIIAIVIAIIVIAIGFATSGSSSKKSKWDSLTKEQKSWYKQTYGGGKSEAIDKAISDYKKGK